jgi:tetratricopeptide (TPR) repeat protein
MSQNLSQNLSQNVLQNSSDASSADTTTYDASTLFQQALSLQNQKKTDDAIMLYHKLLDLGPEKNMILTREQASAASQNLAILYFEKKDSALAYVYNQKALALDERNQSAVEFQKSSKINFQTASIPRDISMLENLNAIGLKYLSIESLVACVAVFLFFTIRNISRFLVNRKKSDLANSHIVKFNLMNYGLILLLFIFSSLLALKIYDTSELKAIVKSAQISVKTAPGENKPIVTQAEIGTIFSVLKFSNDADLTYVQIKFPGAYSGWVKRNELELLNSTKWPVFIDKN